MFEEIFGKVVESLADASPVTAQPPGGVSQCFEGLPAHLLELARGLIEQG